MKAIATIGTGPQLTLLQRSLRTFVPYATRHGYDLIVGDGSMSEAREPAWAKVQMIRRLLDVYDVVVWLDADVMILNSCQDIADELNADSFQALVAHEYPNGAAIPNTGVWILKATHRAREFLDAVWATGDLDGPVRWWDNSAVIKLLGFSDTWPSRLVDPDSEWLVGTQWLSEDWNALTTWTPDPGSARVHHLAGERLRFRVLQMNADLQRLEGHTLRAGLTRLPWRLIIRLRTWPLYGAARQKLRQIGRP